MFYDTSTTAILNKNTYGVKCAICGFSFALDNTPGGIINHFTVVYSVTWPLNGSEARGDLVLIQTSLPLLCKSSCSNASWVHVHD